MYNSIEKLKEGLLNEQTFDLFEIFQNIDTNRTGFIEFEDLSTFLRKSGAVFQDNDVAFFIHKADKDLDCKLSYTELANIVLPISYKAKPSYAEDTQASMLKSAKGNAASPCKRLGSACCSPLGSPLKGEASGVVGMSSGKQIGKGRRHRYGVSVDFAGCGFSPLRFSSKSLLKGNVDIPTLMSYQAEKERMLENLRQDVAIKRDVTLESLCHIFDPADKGYINTFDLMEVFQQFDIHPDNNHFYAVFNRLDRERSGKLCHKEVFELFIPYQQEYAAIFTSKNEVLKKKSAVSQESHKLIKKLLQSYLDTEKENKDWRKSITGSEIREAFEDITKQGRHYFDLADVHSPLKIRPNNI
eukprot:TRINITY_DN5339_c0_g1_i12.p1 TRINITY_DN5339_c0_g1~~TRINITY_DN5339_c0_g1_i12.p1  ORF type:complete len:357 (+),score=70.67 TRINITY_DN5339_c0_g1_i12:728-1798(+)